MNNLHGTAVVLGRHGVLIEGPSGAGKTSLAIELIRRAQTAGYFAALVADDQLLASTVSGRLVVNAPASIAGLVEVHGLGPTPIAHVCAAVIDLTCTLVGTDAAPRYQEPGSRLISGAAIPELRLPERCIAQSAAAIFAHLGHPPFAGMRQNG